MRDERRQFVDDLVADALELTPPQRHEYLVVACGSDDELRSEVESLLAQAELQGMLDATLTFTGFKPQEIVGDRFQIVRFLGRGGMGDVYEAFDKLLKQPVALKTIRPEIASRPDMIARFMREVKIGVTVTDTHICRVFDLERHVGPGNGSADPVAQILFMTMELLHPGETLSRRLKTRGKLPLPEAAAIAGQMAAGLGALHACGYIHRDLKSANVMLVEASEAAVHPRAVLTDLGLARSVGRNSVSAPFFERSGRSGTPEYMAPEQMRGGVLSRATDVYAFGVILHEMITGELPCGGKAGVRVADRAWREAIVQCLETDPAKRPASAAAAIRGIALGRSQWRLWLAAAAMLVLCAALSWRWLVPLLEYHPARAAQRWYDQGVRALRDGTYFNAMRAFQQSVDIDKNFALAHARLAEAAAELGFESKAKTEVLLAEAPGTAPLVRDAAEKLRLNAAFYVVNKDYAHAADVYRKLLDRSADADRAGALVDLGRALEDKGDLKSAIRCYTDSAKFDPQYAAAFLRLGMAYRKQHELKKAEANLTQAEGLYRTEGNEEGVTEVLYRRAEILNASGRMNDAHHLLDQILRNAESDKNEYQLVRALLLMSNGAYMWGRFTEGKDFARRAVDIASREGLEGLAASGLVDLGSALYFRGEYQEARGYLDSAYAIAVRQNLAGVQARAASALGSVLLNQGKPEAGLVLLQKALQFYESNGMRREALRTLIPIARVIRDEGDYAQAAASFGRALRLSDELNDTSGKALAEEGLGTVALLREEYPLALDHFQNSLDLNSKMGNTLNEAYGLCNVATVLWNLGKYRNAEALLTRAQQVGSESNEICLCVFSERAEMEISEDHRDDARKFLQLSSKYVDKDDEAEKADLNRMACLLDVRWGAIPKATQECHEAARLAEEARDAFLRTQTKLANAEIALAGRDGHAALKTCAPLISEFSRNGQLNSLLHALSYAQRAARMLGDRSAVSEYAAQGKAIRQRLGEELGIFFKTYMERADIQSLVRGTISS